MKISDLRENLGSSQDFGFFRKSWSFDENLGFLRKSWIFAKISDFRENLGFHENLGFLRKSRIFAKISDFREIRTQFGIVDKYYRRQLLGGAVSSF